MIWILMAGLSTFANDCKSIQDFLGSFFLKNKAEMGSIFPYWILRIYLN